MNVRQSKYDLPIKEDNAQSYISFIFFLVRVYNFINSKDQVSLIFTDALQLELRCSIFV